MTIHPLPLSAGVTADSTPSSQKKWDQHKTSVSHSFGFIPCSFEEFVALFFLEDVADVADGFPELVAGPGCGFSERGGSENDPVNRFPDEWP